MINSNNNGFNEFKENDVKYEVINHSLQLNTEHDKILDIFNDTLKESSEDNQQNILPMTATLKRDSKLERIIYSLLEENKKFSIIDYFKRKCKSKSKRIILYGYAIKNLEEILDIRNYLKTHLELNLIKQVLFDEFQFKIFNTISPVIGFKHLFEEEENKQVRLSEYKKVEFNDFFDFVHHLLSRKNLVDNKILEFINKQLVVHT
jgi:hypothetical protein